MAIASQYVRGRAAKPSLTGYPFYLLIDGDAILYATKAGPFPEFSIGVTEANGGDVEIVTSPVYAGERSVECDATAASNARANIDEIPFLFDVAYPFRISSRAYLTEITHLWNGISLAALRKGVVHVCGVGKWISSELYFEADHHEGQAVLPTNMVVDAWNTVEVISISDTQYYVEVNGVKYGPLTKPAVGQADRTSVIGVWQVIAKASQLKLILDDIMIHKPESAYDTSGAIAPGDVYTFHDDFETGSGLSPFTVTTAGGGTLTRSTAQKYEGSYSMEVNTLGNPAKVAWARHDPGDGQWNNLEYPIWHETMFRFEDYDAGQCDVRICDLYKVAAMSIEFGAGEEAGPPVHIGLKLKDAAGWHTDLGTLSLATWHKLQLKELNDTDVQIFLDDVQVPAGVTYTKMVAGKVDRWDNMGDQWNVSAAIKCYWDNMRWYREV